MTGGAVSKFDLRQPYLFGYSLKLEGWNEWVLDLSPSIQLGNNMYRSFALLRMTGNQIVVILSKAKDLCIVFRELMLLIP